jgi:hypothetical protein
VNEVTDLHEPQDTGPDPFSSDPNAFQDSATDGAPANSLGEKAANRLSSNEIIAGNEAGGFDTEDPDELGAQAAEAFDSNTIDTIGTEAANELGEADEIDPNVYKEQQIQKEAGESLNNEFAAEVAAPPAAAENPKLDREANRKQDDIDVDATETGDRMVGWLALALSILSLFAYPVLLGTTGVILGIVAYAQGRRALGVWSILIGGLSLLSYFVLVPFYT